MVRVWLADASPLYREEIYAYYYARMPAFRKEKADRLKNPGAKIECVGAWALWQKVRSVCIRPCAESAESVTEEYSGFNLSHSGQWVLCAAHLGEEKVRVGCDIEKIGKNRLKVAKHFFCPEEYADILRAGEADRQNAVTAGKMAVMAGQQDQIRPVEGAQPEIAEITEAAGIGETAENTESRRAAEAAENADAWEESAEERFCRYWVLKESFLKAVRKGLMIPMNTFSVQPGDPPLLLQAPPGYTEKFFYREYQVEQIPCRMAVCSTDRDIDKNLQMEFRL